MKKALLLLTFMLSLFMLSAESGNSPSEGWDFRELRFSLYTDFTVSVGAEESNDSTGDKEWEPYFTFDQEDFTVIGSVAIDNISVLCDISPSCDFWELALFRDKSTFTVGRIFIPFGDIDYHPVYGGYANEDSLFLPYTWVDYGVKGAWKIGDYFQFETGITNGFAVDSSNEPVFTESSTEESNFWKAVTLRATLFPSDRTKGSFSFMYDSYGEDEEEFMAKVVDKSILFFGTDWSHSWERLALKGGVAFMEVNIPDSLDTWKYGWYGEGSYGFPDFTLRLRAGGIDTDLSKDNEEDVMNVNGGILIPMGRLEWQAVYLYSFPIHSAGYDTTTGRSHELTTKLVFNI
ncbi:MAG: hypothetical protein PQJ60_01730 [Spirochaetales bacterium]|nr:hypothetical protein [Spirochaetales bacterium]